MFDFGKIKIEHLIPRVEIFTKFARSKLKFNSNKNRVFELWQQLKKSEDILDC